MGELPESKESNLVVHARRELQILGEDEQTIAGYLKVVQAFASMGHSGCSASIAIPVLMKLLSYQNLKPLTNNPSEWTRVGDFPVPMWQSVRNSECFSEDGGKTYYRLSEIVTYGSKQERPIHASEEML